MYLVRLSRLQTIIKLSQLAVICTIILIIPISICSTTTTPTATTTSTKTPTIVPITYKNLHNWDPYKVLGVDYDATMVEIERAHSSLLEKSRIDRSTSFETRFDEIQKAYDYLRLQNANNQNNHHNYHHQQQQQDKRSTIVDSKNQEAATLSTDETEKKSNLASRLAWRVVTYSIRFMNYSTALEITSSLMLFIVAFCTLLLISRKWKSSQQTSSIGAISEDSNSNNSISITTENRKLQQQDNHYKHYLAMKILELHLETYNGMVRLSSPGHRTIVLLCDQDSKDKLICQFKKAVWPYRKNKTLLFGYLCLDKNLDWYRSILEEVLGIELLSLNKKYCIGTVLSLNGYKRYFRLYHAKHRESNYNDDDDYEDELEGYNPDISSQLKTVDQSGESSGRSLDDGLLSESNFKGSGKVVYVVDNLLDQLPDWLDKMFEGLTKKYPLDAWPDDMR